MTHEHRSLQALIDRLRELDKAAEPGPWVPWDLTKNTDGFYEGPGVSTKTGVYVCSTATDEEGSGCDDAQLIAEARNTLPTLLEALAIQNGALEHLNSHGVLTARNALAKVDALVAKGWKR